jgi:hypothetical protein
VLALPAVHGASIRRLTSLRCVVANKCAARVLAFVLVFVAMGIGNTLVLVVVAGKQFARVAACVLAFTLVFRGVSVWLTPLRGLVTLVGGITVRNKNTRDGHKYAVRGVLLDIVYNLGVIDVVLFTSLAAVSFVSDMNEDLAHFIEGSKRLVVFEVFEVVVAADNMVRDEFDDFFYIGWIQNVLHGFRGNFGGGLIIECENGERTRAIKNAPSSRQPTGVL